MKKTLKTAEQLKTEFENLKKSHNVVHTVNVPLNGADPSLNLESVATIFLRKPDLAVRSAFSAVADKDYWRGVKVLITNLWIGGDDKEMILADDDAVFSCGKDGAAFTEIMNGHAAILKKN